MASDPRLLDSTLLAVAGLRVKARQRRPPRLVILWPGEVEPDDLQPHDRCIRVVYDDPREDIDHGA